MKRLLTLGFSPCPNDTFIFYSMVHGLIDTAGLTFSERLEDVETLNRLAVAGELDVTKVSYHALGYIRDQYALLRSGSALGRGCGPLLVSQKNINLADLSGRKIAVPGQFTTALLLLRLFNPRLENFIIMPFNDIMEAVLSGQADAGLIIHESRFTYQELGLQKLIDLGEWWEGETGLPIPLGGIVARRSLGEKTIVAIERALKDSIVYASSHPDQAIGYIRKHSQEMSDEVCAAHIQLYVNDFSVNLGEEGKLAIDTLMKRAENVRLIPHSTQPLF